MDIIGLAIDLAQGIRCIVAALKGEATLILECRQLMHSCQLYEDCLNTLQTSMNENYLLAGAKSGTSKMDLEASIARIRSQVELDCTFLEQVLKEATVVGKNAKKNHYVRAILNVSAGRQNKIKELQSELATRVQMITSLMMKDVWKSTSGSGVDNELLDEIGDVDGTFFWIGHFGPVKKVSFLRFKEAYQGYLTQTLFFRKLDGGQLSTLLRHTLLDEKAKFEGELLACEVTVATFACWLKRFGPMNDTVHKCSALSLPLVGVAASWFHKSMNRDGATRLIEANLTKSTVSSENLIVVRYSSDPKNHFVITTKLPSKKIEHFPVVNGPLGYTILGDTDEYSKTVVECVQKHVMEKLFVPVLGPEVKLSMDNLDQWGDIFASATTQLAEDHYTNVGQLNAAASSIEDIVCLQTKCATFGSLFGGNKMPPAVPAVTISKASATPAGEGDVSDENDRTIGRYMVRHGLFLLRRSGEIDEVKYQSLMAAI